MPSNFKIFLNKSKLFGILIAVLTITLIIAMSLSLTNAWFTDYQQLIKSSDIPNIDVNLVKTVNSNVSLDAEFTNSYISTNSITKVYVRVDTNINYVYLRAQVVAYYYDSNDDILGNYDASDCFNLMSGWYSLDSGNVYKPGYLYWGSSSAPSQISVAQSNVTAVATELISSFSIPETLPTGAVGIKFQIFAEAVQGNSTGLSKWVI